MKTVTEAEANEAAAEVTDEDVREMVLAFYAHYDPVLYREQMAKCQEILAPQMRRAAEALAHRWGRRSLFKLSPEVTAGLERLIRELKE